MLYLKALHIIFVVTWFAGLFYIVRLFVYKAEAQEKDEQSREVLFETFSIMQKRLWFGITWPSAVLTFIFGHWLLVEMNWHKSLFQQGWEWLTVKYLLVWLLLGYHLYCHAIYKKQSKNIFSLSGNQLRVINEGATLFLISIVFLVVVKQTLSLVYGALGLVLFAALLMLAIRLYKRVRE
jgi:putative membrane protein